MAPAGSCVRVCLVCWRLPVCICECVCVCLVNCALTTCLVKASFKAGPPPPLEAILVIFGRRALNFFFVVWKLLEKNEKWHHFCAHAQWWSSWRCKNVEKGHLAPSNLTFLLIAIDRNGFRRMKEEGQIYKTLPQIFQFLPRDLVMIFQSLVMILPRFFDFERP